MSRVVDRWHRRDRTRTPLYGRGQRWQAVWTDGRGREEKRAFPTKGAAEAWLRAHDGFTPATRPTVAEYATQWEARQIHQRKSSRDTIATRVRLTIVPTLGGRLLDQVTRGDVQDAVLAWSEEYGLAPATVRLTYTYLSGLFTEAQLDGLVKSSPCVRIRLPPLGHDRIVPLTVEQVQAIADTISPRYRAAVIVAATTGLRPGEWRGLTADRVDLENGLVLVDRQYGPETPLPRFGPLKTAASRRVISVGPSTLEVLGVLCEDPGPAGLLFHHGGEGFTRKRASGVWAAMRRKLPWAGPGWHQLRHHHASVLLSQGASVIAVARRLGHKDATETIQTYAHVMPEDDTRLVSMSDGLLRLNRPGTAHEEPGPA